MPEYLGNNRQDMPKKTNKYWHLWTGKMLSAKSTFKEISANPLTFSPQNVFFIIPLCDAKLCKTSIFFSSDTEKLQGCEAGVVSPVAGHRWLFITLKAADCATFLEILTSKRYSIE